MPKPPFSDPASVTLGGRSDPCFERFTLGENGEGGGPRGLDGRIGPLHGGLPLLGACDLRKILGDEDAFLAGPRTVPTRVSPGCKLPSALTLVPP